MAIRNTSFQLSPCTVAGNAQPYRDAFEAVTPTNFDSGGEVSRQFHLNAESYQRTTTIARTQPVVLIGPYEHPSNELSWRQSMQKST